MKMRRWLGALALTSVALIALPTAGPAIADDANAPVAGGWTIVKFPTAACTGVGTRGAQYFDRLDCGFGFVPVSETTPSSEVFVQFIGKDGSLLDEQRTFYRASDDAWEFDILPESSWPSDFVTIRVSKVNGAAGNFGETTFFLNHLGASLSVEGDPAPGDDLPVSGQVFQIDQITSLSTEETGVPATFSLQLKLPDGSTRGPYGPYTAEDDGSFEATIPGSATSGLSAGPDTNYQVGISIEAIDAAYDEDLLRGDWSAARAGAGAHVFTVPPTGLVLENSYVSAVGWVKPGEGYPFRVLVKNYSEAAADGGTVTIPAADGMRFLAASPNAVVTESLVTWTVGSVPAGTDAGPGVATLVVQARADTLDEDPQVVWKNLSTTAEHASGTSTSLGPKVIPPKATFETARYGFRPFPVVPVDYFDRMHEPEHTGKRLSDVINSPAVEGSTFNLYQEMSFGQLEPNGTVPSAGIASRGWSGSEGSRFTDPDPQGTCHGATYKSLKGSAAYAERIRDGWYQLPGDTQYYGGDRYGSALPGAIVGVGPLMDIDSACGPTGKAVYDAAHIADPEIDYSDYDTDKDGVVDFFMMVFVGDGGHGASQTSVPPYDNIWPHSSSLEFYFTDEATGLKGYISDDQLKDLEGYPLWYTDDSRSQMTRTNTGDDLKVLVRVGPYNVNPESAVEHASVISHEYGHSLGLPDYYSLGSRETYGDWNLMATDKSQHMDVNAKVELGWIVPNVLESTGSITGWRDSKIDTNEINWKQRDGTPYTLSGPTVDNGEAYAAALPKRLLIDPAKVAAGASPDHVWWSQSGNDFGCPPAKGHNLDVFLPELKDVAPGTPVTVSFKSYWDIEWDYDYGFTMISTDGGRTYRSLPSQKGYTTDRSFNPNANSCHTQFSNGLTGTSGSYAAGTHASDRLVGRYPDGGFLADEYTFSATGEETVLRFAYATDPGLARPAWFIDDLQVRAGDTVIYQTDFEQADDPRLFNGGCSAHGRVAAACTHGWQYVSASAGSPADHAYYLELRDRSGFDAEGRGQNDRDPIAFLSGLLLVYTDEAHGYGNVGTDDPPAQSPLDSQPQPGNEAPNLHDAAWTAAAGDNRFSDSGAGHTDNYSDPKSEDELWHFRFNCMTFDVQSMSGEDVNEDAFNLAGDVAVTVGPGCAPFDYGYNPDLPPPPAPPGQEQKPQPQPQPAPQPGPQPAPQPAPQPQPRAPQRGPCTINGTAGRDRLVGTPGPDGICGRGGNDVIIGLGGNDRLYGGAGNDRLVGGAGRDRLYGGLGNDSLAGEAGNDLIEGESGHDRLSGGLGSDRILGRAGRDRIIGGAGTDRLSGGRGNDRLSAGSGRMNVLFGNAGNDVLLAFNGRPDRVIGGAGRDQASVDEADVVSFVERLARR